MNKQDVQTEFLLGLFVLCAVFGFGWLTIGWIKPSSSVMTYIYIVIGMLCAPATCIGLGRIILAVFRI